MAAARYWRIIGVETSGASSDLTLHGIDWYESASLQSGTLTCTVSPTVGTLSNLTDSDTATYATFADADIAPPGFMLTWDFATAKDISEIRFTAGTNSDAFIANFNIQSSTDGIIWQDSFSLDYRSKLVYPGYLSEASVVIYSDIYRQYVVLHLHCDGANGSTTVTDSRSTPKTFTASGNAQISTAQSKFGGASLSFDGTADWFQTTTNMSDFAFDYGDFTVECFVKTSDSSCNILDCYYYGGWRVRVSSSGKLSWIPYLGSTKSGSITINDNAWHHIAVSRTNGRIALFVDGVLDGDPEIIASFYSVTATVFSIGAQVAVRDPTYDFSGYIDEVRITKGASRYTSGCTPPTTAFSEVSMSVATTSVTASRFANDPIIVGSINRGDTQITAPAVTKIIDMEDGGLFRVTGTVKEKATPSNTPLKRKVRLHREPDGRMIRETWSDASTGTYTFDYIRGDCTYYVTTFDYLHNYRAVIADNLTAEAMP